ncbi:hypothetical protein KFL_000550270 [Klebsormidium nitens]|uniref:Uncharacterized protein n=1 Tax=Klebsormidium nitens TaxID=105231 RepID=A0A1Y1HVD3_KLENI|nr:hypothetical protein KFL_000550270 [Klebsormidium nitens]|eukprot:GAQ80497.1 hypothetical protein KFL_000550270 [Klebsormidium nitens]
MVATATLVGALFGAGVQFYSNAVRKLPAMREPWKHVLGAGLGAVCANEIVKFEEKTKVELEAQIEESKKANRRRFQVGGAESEP